MASRVCILTDSTAQFTSAHFPGQELVKVIPLQIHFNGKHYPDSRDLKLKDLPITIYDASHPRLIPPTSDDFRQAYLSLEEEFDEIITVLLSANLSPSIVNAKEAATSLLGKVSLQIIDSRSIGVGLGLLVQTIAEALHNGVSSLEVHLLASNLIRHLYSFFCVQSLTYLCRTAHLDPAQALVGEMLGIIPVIILENGRLMPIQKAHSPRQMVDLLYEFVSEFGALQHITLIKGTISFDQGTRHIRERISEIFPTTSYSEHTLDIALACMLGPCSLGLVALED